MTLSTVDRIRKFNRAYVAQLGLFSHDYLGMGYSVSEFRVLKEFCDNPDTTARQVAKVLDVDEGQISRTIKRFVDKGWLTRKPSTDDARRKIVTVTDAGRAFFAAADERGNTKTAERLGVNNLEKIADLTDEIMRLLGHLPPSDIDLRHLDFGDAGWITQRHAETYAIDPGFTPDFEPFVFSILADFIAHNDPNRERAFIAWRAGKRVGSIMCTASKDPEVAKLRLFFVEPEMRGRGLGKHLMSECLTFARHAGYKHMTLMTHKTQTVAREMYARSGFTCTSSRADHLFGCDAIEEIWQIDL